MRQDTESFLLLLRQRASGLFDLGPWFTANEERVAGVMDTVLSARGDDAGRIIGGARKDRGMFTQMFLNAGLDPTQALAALEAQGGDVAFKAVTRDKLIPKPVPSALRELGDSAGSAYAKTVLYGYITPRPYNSAKARERYVKAAQVVSEVFATPYPRLNDLLNALILRYYIGIVKDDPEGILLTDAQQAAMVPAGVKSWDFSRLNAARLGKNNYANAYDNATIFYNDDKTPQVYRRESEEEKKERASIFNPLGPRFLDVVDSPYVDDKKAWFTDRNNARTYDKNNDWAWAGGASASTEGGTEEKAEVLYREDILPPPDCERMKEEGDSPEAVYLYAWAYKNLLPKKSKPTKQGQEDFKTALEHFDHVLADRSNYLALLNTLNLRKDFHHVNAYPDAVLPINALPPSTTQTLTDFLNQEIYPPISSDERKKQALSLLEEELGMKVAGYLTGPYTVRRQKTYYYRVYLPDSDREELAKERRQVSEALKRLNPNLFDLLENGLDTKKLDSLARKEAYRAGWNDVAVLCKKILEEAEGRSRDGRGFTLPSRGVEGPRSGPPVPGPHTSESIQRTSGLYGIEYGNWMNDTDKATVNVSVAEALHDLAHVLGVPLNAVSLGKRLALALGARGSGRMAAHYEPWSKAINMTRTSGSGSLAHEWGHALDHWIADAGGSRVVNGKLTSYFASMLDGANGLRGVDVSPEERKAINDAMLGVTDLIIAGKQGYTDARMRHWDKEHPAPDVPKHPNAPAYSGWEFSDAFRRRTGLPFDPHGGFRYLPDTKPASTAAWTEGDRQYVDAMYRYRDEKNAYDETRRALLNVLIENAKHNEMLKFAEKQGEYWQRNEEMFARSWESYVNDKLENEGRYNGYLVRGTKKTGEAYPQGDQRARLHVAFDALNNALRPVLRRIATRPNGRGSRKRPVLRKPR